MKKFLFILVLACCALIFYVFYTPKNTEFEPISCDLNTQDCVFEFKGEKIFVSLNPKPIEAMSVMDLKIQNLKAKDLKLKIYGLNMYMGEIKPKLVRLENGDYESKVVLSSCTLDVMRYRALFEPVGFYFDFELRR